MARSTQWRRTCSDLVNWRQTEAQNATIYILRETGPTGFLLKEEGVAKPCKAFLGDPHSCTCSQFMKDRDLCKHICWLLLKKFRVPQTNQMSWQAGLVEREINEILRGLTQQQRKKVPTAVARWRRPLSNDSDAREVLPQRDIAEDDVCPICQDELLEKRLPVTYCKFGCGNSIHIKCMKIWAEHQKSQGETTVKCPFCREDFGPFEMLKYENRNAEGAPQGGRMDRHIGITCQSCHVFPIEGKCYRCSSCADFYLCQSCFNTPIHTQHAFQYRHKRNQRWRPAGRAYGAVLPQAVMDDLVNRDISETDYELLMQLDSNAQPVGSDIPEDVIQSFPMEKVRENGPLLAPGMQCRVCLRGYQVGQLVRRLPRCKHKFHRDCIDSWLLHSRPTCPIDGQTVWDPVTAQLDEDDRAGRTRPKKKPSISEGSVQHANTVNLEIPGMGLTLRMQEPTQHSQPQPRAQPQGRVRQPLRRQSDRNDREAMRVLGALHTNFALNGTAVNGAGYESDNDMGGQLPGARLLDRANVRQAALSQRLSHLQNNIPRQQDQEMSGLVTTQIEQENIDPLDEVVAANQDQHEYQQTSPIHEPHRHHVVQERRPNHGSLFAQQVSSQPDVTENLLANMERLSPYRENPNVFMDAALAQQMALESSRTNGTNVSAETRQLEGQRSRQFLSNEELQARVFSDMPPEQRLFATNGNSQATQSDSHIMFNPNSSTVPAGAGRGSNSNKAVNKGRQQSSVSSAPASLDERGRRAERGWSQNNSTTRNRSSSRGRDRSRERGGHLQNGAIPKEGENLLQRLSIFSDLYLGNSPNSNPPVSGIVTTATGLPPRAPQRRQYSNQAAARQRRFENERRKNNFQLEGNSCNDNITLRDLLG